VYRYLQHDPWHWITAKHSNQRPSYTKEILKILYTWIWDLAVSYEDAEERVMFNPVLHAVVLMERFMASSQTQEQSIQRLQLVFLACLWMVSKYAEEAESAFTIHDMLHLCDNAYSTQDLLEMERIMLAALDFDVTDLTLDHAFVERTTTSTTSTTLSIQAHHQLRLRGIQRWLGTRIHSPETFWTQSYSDQYASALSVDDL
jgi:cyclin B